MTSSFLNPLPYELVAIPKREKDKIYFHYDYGRGKGQRPTGIFIYAKPKDQIQKNHNKEALKLLEVKKSQLTIDEQAMEVISYLSISLKATFLIITTTTKKTIAEKETDIY